MKIQCACGAKYAFDLTPEQARQPVQFICPACGLDSSAYVTELARQQFGFASAAPLVGMAPATEIALPPGATSTPSPVAAVIAPPPAPAAAVSTEAPPVPRVRLHRGGEKPADLPASGGDVRFCSKHPGVRTTEQCVVCSKPICPKCMQVFGYVSSPFCKEKADLQGIEVAA